MELDLKMCRFESAPWGFRLVGGADFELPLTVVKVAEGGLAEQAGMRIGDTVIRINDKSTAEMSHTDVHKFITECGNNFFLSVYRDENLEFEYIDEAQQSAEPQTQEVAAHPTQEPPVERANGCIQNAVEVVEPTNEEQQVADVEVADVEVAEITSGEERAVSEEKTKASFFQTSEVFQTIKEDSWKTMVEKEKDKRKWSTFLQKPDRPVPRNKFEPDIPAEPYMVKIVKQQKPRVAPDRPPSPPPQILEQVLEQEEEPSADTEEIKEEEEVYEPPTDTEVPNLEPTDEALPETEGIEGAENGGNVEAEIPSTDEGQNEKAEEPEVVEPPKKTEEEIVFEKQLTDIQKQLMALSSLPSTIQATLDAVTRQLSELLPNVKLDLPLASSISAEAESCVQSTEQECCDVQSTECECTEDCCQNVVTEVSCETEHVEASDEQSFCEQQHMIEERVTESREEIRQQLTQETTVYQEQHEEEFMVEEHSSKSQKQLVMLELEHKQRLIKERSAKRPPRAFGPLTPQERPLVLPGGRKWRRPKDAFNDEFIADTLSAQAELIVGHTLGTTSQSTNVAYDPRVNFLKFKKPEKHIDLEKSEVYKVIHSLDEGPRRGIEVRPEKVMAAADVCAASS